MRAVAAALLLTLLGVWASGSALARKGGGHAGGGKPHGGGGHPHPGGKQFGAHQGHHHHGHHRHGHHHHHKGGAAFVGFGFAYPWWYPPYYYYHYPHYPQPVAYPAQPVTYVEQGGAPAEPAGWWHYCESARAYYPYVKDCASGWQRVPALPPPPN